MALQGGFAEHIRMLDALSVDAFEIRKREELEQPMDGLIIPGGESTTIGKLLKDLDMFQVLKTKLEEELPVFGTCAGMILLAKYIVGSPIAHLGVMDITVCRNAYGRQLGSFLTAGNLKGVGTVPMVFIRAPYIQSVGPEVEVLSEVDGHIVTARERNMLVTSYHPELTTDNRVHRFFVEEVVMKAKRTVPA